MSRLTIAALLLTASAPALAADKSFSVAAFQKVAASGSENIVITTGKSVSVTATGPQERLDKLDIRVEGDTLKIGHKPGNWGWNWSSGEVVVRVTMPALHGLSIAGSGDATADAGGGPDFGLSISGSGNAVINRLASPNVRISVAGSGDASLPRLETQALSIKTAGSGNVTAAGTCNAATVSVSGSSDISAAGLKCVNADVGVSGSGNVSLFATGTAAVRVSGSGDVDIKGGAKCQVKTSGSGDVSCG
jgi:hypothetical protein